MYCKKHDVFWRIDDSLYCPICLLEYNDNISAQLKIFMAVRHSVIKDIS